ncbi:pentapeptide repeat-containing protein [Micromonospora sp. CA-269861]|uniref:pentapeptide repeat-containing protein n=1 Tax=Micromonospora sp. CA-269861 TaxID=3239968 RepID=UPI003D94DB85
MTKRWSVSLIAAGVLGLLGVALVRVPGSWWPVLASEWPVLLPVTASLTVLLVGVLFWHRTTEERQASAAPTAPIRQVQPLRSWVIPVGMVLVAVVTWAAIAWLQGSLPAMDDGTHRAQLRVESIRTGLTIGAAVTGAFALLLAFRRQQLAERTQQATEYDAGEKRVTELYVKAADQLGSDKAPVRLAGLYALERLAHDNPAHRQSIVEVICAYLRMPHALQYTESLPTSPAPTLPTAAAGDTAPDTPSVELREEQQVRLAAQRILARHLRPATQGREPNPSYWGPTLVLDLTEAALINAEFTGCHLHNADFTAATFRGFTRFDGATFSGTATFVGTTFSNVARFDRTTFKGAVGIVQAMFSGDAWFDEATFSDGAWFDQTTFAGVARFSKATFSGSARFVQTTFSDDARFSKATFGDTAIFVETTFSNVARFDDTTFTGDADFEGATLGGASYDGPKRVAE